ncbi:MAG TPA: type II toxin-antitoxin system death-on-curing family toxin, partial [Chthoniobacterales bacterium]|nr:type II toxin-antitoxin system death-on-curing family toxin [Chthoniobacterales bacterium]
PNKLSWIWIRKDTLLAIHDEQLAEHGGESGVRSETLLDSALDRPKNKAHYGRPSAGALAATYAFGLLKNHPFLDGNKRTAAVVSELFLNLHNAELRATDAQVVATIEGVAAGRISEEELVSFFEAHTHGDC